MKSLKHFISSGVLVVAAAFLSSCQVPGLKTDNYDSPAYRPKNPSNVRVKVSTSKQMVYVMEGDRPLLVTATCVGYPGKETPLGNFQAYNKIAKKRSGSYGFAISGNTITPTKAGQARGRYVGYPMPYWVEFKPAYGFHAGYVWNIPRSHGCLRLHPNVAPKFFALVKAGTPINIQRSQPEDATLGANHKRPGPEHYMAPDPPASVSITDAPFNATAGRPIFAD
jgi:hypothetical protein